MNWNSDMSAAPRDGSRLLMTRYPFNGNRIPLKIAWWGTWELKAASGTHRGKGWIIGSRKRLRWEPTHWAHIEPPAPDGGE